MGFFWDLIQQSQLHDQKTKTGSLESRLVELESELRRTQQVLHTLVTRLEQHFGEDIDRDGQVG